MPISTFCLEVDLSENHLSYIKKMIPHFLVLDVDIKIYQAQLSTSIRGCHVTFLVKNTLLKKEVT